jgi:Kef-type K+ transport system membrane component KefB
MLNLRLLIVQIAVILIAAGIVGVVFRRLRQPTVVGEMVAGILLGPSFLGWLAPDLSGWLFPADSLSALNALGQVGLLLFMFIIGLRFDVGTLRNHGHTATAISHVSIVVPFVLGASLGTVFYSRLSDGNVPVVGFALFMGAAMSVTAFPVLARILEEHNLSRTRVGTLAIAAAAVDDVTAWLLLALITILVRSHGFLNTLYFSVAGTLIYAALMIFGARSLGQRLKQFFNTERLSPSVLALVLLFVLSSAFVTDWLGIHTLFGAFVAGAVMPRDDKLVSQLSEKFESLTVVLFLPIFFALAGLRTSISLVITKDLWFYCVIIIAIAVAGKLGGSMLCARAFGMPWREAGAIGALMNTRGLMELVILSIGLELGVISPTVYSMMVCMAVLTTLMTSPLLKRIYPRSAFEAPSRKDRPVTLDVLDQRETVNLAA